MWSSKYLSVYVRTDYTSPRTSILPVTTCGDEGLAVLFEEFDLSVDLMKKLERSTSICLDFAVKEVNNMYLFS